MTDFRLVDAAIFASLSADELDKAVVYVADEVRSAGTAVLGSKEIAVGHPHVIAFVDRRPGANWMHSCRYLVVDADNHRIQSVEGDRPPVFGFLPPHWRVARKAPGIEDWQLLKIDRTEDQASHRKGGG